MGTHIAVPHLMENAEHHFADVEGVRLHWVELRSRTNEPAAPSRRNEPPLVLLHGLNNSHLTWKRVAPLLAAGRRVLMPDLPGHGRSARPDAGYELAWHARIMGAWLESLGVPQVDVIGHSFGGGVAQMLLLECPDRIRRLGLVASGGLGQDVGWILRLASLPLFVEHFGQRFMALGTRLALRSAQAGVTEEDVAELSAFNSQPGSARAFARTVRDVIDWRGQRRTFSQRADQLRALPPVLVLWGDRDDLIPMAHGRAFSTLAEGAVFVPFEGCGHYLHNERPHEFVAAVSEFLSSSEAAPARLRRAEKTDAGVLSRLRDAIAARAKELRPAGLFSAPSAA